MRDFFMKDKMESRTIQECIDFIYELNSQVQVKCDIITLASICYYLKTLKEINPDIDKVGDNTEVRRRNVR